MSWGLFERLWGHFGSKTQKGRKELIPVSPWDLPFGMQHLSKINMMASLTPLTAFESKKVTLGVNFARFLLKTCFLKFFLNRKIRVWGRPNFQKMKLVKDASFMFENSTKISFFKKRFFAGF